ncbi:hypothetical protein [Paenibacillus sp. S02]|uniref:hypothetical protein n=1 Tax=Paenibacillus sp. S02 TaxID=2823904 RepID=UPI0021AC86F6|nr:hypothetical protein [Paenibacillus sp. S02]
MGSNKCITLRLAAKNVRVAGLHVAFMDTDMTAGIHASKSSPKDISRTAIDGIEADLYEIVADATSREVQQGVAGGVPSLYPQLFQ